MVGMIINNVELLVDLLKTRNTLKLYELYTARVNNVCQYHITRAPTEARIRNLPLPRRALYH